MTRRLQFLITLLSLVFLTGGQWGALQSVAWVNMTLSNSRTMPLAKAISETFSQNSKCDLCRLVDATRDQEKRVPGLNSKSLLQGIIPTSLPEFLYPILAALPQRPPSFQEQFTSEPPAPPPRLLYPQRPTTV